MSGGSTRRAAEPDSASGWARHGEGPAPRLVLHKVQRSPMAETPADPEPFSINPWSMRIDFLDGIVSAAQLMDAGWSRRSINSALSNGNLVRVAYGSYCFAPLSTEDLAIRAVKLGCWVTCFSALERHGLWVPRIPGPPHLCTTYNRLSSGKARSKSVGSHRRWTRNPSKAPVLDIVDSLTEAIHCGTSEQAFIVLESALRLGKVTPTEVDRIVGKCFAYQAKSLGSPGRFSESGTESAFAFRMNRLGIRFRQQVNIAGIGRVDFLIGDSLVVELDSFEHHQASRRGFNRDRERDADLHLRGYRVIRLTYDQVFYKWEECERRVVEAIRQGFHRKRVR